MATTEELNQVQTTDTTTQDTTTTDTQVTDSANGNATNTDTQETANDATVADSVNTTQEDAETQITELYVATFDRAPDADGVDYWVEQYNNGMSMDDIAKSFFDQKETEDKYSNLTNDEFVDTVYQNVLDRKPDSAGAEYWKSELDSGHITKDEFILAILNGAKSHPEDHKHLRDKTDIGLKFVKEDLNDTDKAKEVIHNYKLHHNKELCMNDISKYAEEHHKKDGEMHKQENHSEDGEMHKQEHHSEDGEMHKQEHHSEDGEHHNEYLNGEKHNHHGRSLEHDSVDLIAHNDDNSYDDAHFVM